MSDIDKNENVIIDMDGLDEPIPSWVEPIYASRRALEAAADAIRLTLAALDERSDPSVGIVSMLRTPDPDDVALKLFQAACSIVAPERGMMRDPEMIARRARQNKEASSKWKACPGSNGVLSAEREASLMNLIWLLHSDYIQEHRPDLFRRRRRIVLEHQDFADINDDTLRDRYKKVARHVRALAQGRR